MNKRYLSFLPILTLIVMIAVLYFAVKPSVFYDPAWLIPITNTLFVAAVNFAVAYIAVRNYRATGRIQILLMGCGVLIFGTGGMIAGFVRGLPGGANLNVTVYNTGALVGALFHFIAALILISGISAETGSRQKELWSTAGYLGVMIFMILLTAASFRGMIPSFFIQGSGPTPLRQGILGTAGVLFAFSFLVFMATYFRNREEFLYWYSLALALTSISLTAFFMESSVGSPVGWAGRFSQYLGGIYFLIAIITAIRSAEARRTSFDNVIAASLSPAEEKFRAVAENSPDIIDRFDREMRHIYVNPAGLRLYGKPARSIIGKTIEETGVPEAYCRLWKERIRKVFETGKPLEVEDYFPSASGTRFYQSRCVPECGVDGAVANVLVISRDLSDRKLAEEALRRSEERYRGLFDNMVEGFAYCKMVFENGKPQDFVYLSVNHAFETLTGLKNVVGKRVTEVIPGVREADPALIETYGRVSLTGKPERFEMFVEALKMWFSISVYSPEKEFFVAVFDVITERKRVEESMRASEERFRMLFERAGDAIFLLKAEGDDAGRILAANKAAADMHGYTVQDLMGMKITDLDTPDAAREAPPLIGRMLRGEWIKKETTHRGKDGLAFPVEMSAGLLEYGGQKYILALDRDSTERKRAEEEINELNKELAYNLHELDAANKELEAFIYSVSHDLRAPLRSISGFSDFLLDQYSHKLDDKGKKYLDWVIAGAAKMNQTIDDLLHLSRISRHEVLGQDVDMSKTARSIIAELRRNQPDRRVRVDIKEGLTARADPRLMEIALLNLLSNAWKFTSKTDNARIEFGSFDQEGKTVYFVKDNGAGFDQKFSERLFLPFQRLHTEQEFEGTGVGLAIVERVVRRHGGKIWAEGKTNEGAAFFFTLS